MMLPERWPVAFDGWLLLRARFAPYARRAMRRHQLSFFASGRPMARHAAGIRWPSPYRLRLAAAVTNTTLFALLFHCATPLAAHCRAAASPPARISPM